MEGEEGGLRLSKRINNGEVDYKTKSGTAWSHSFLNQKPWHPLSYPNQRRKWIAEQSHAQHQRRAEEVAREYAQEQDFFKQTALISQKEKEKIETMQAVSFMYVRPPGYNAESAKAAEVADQSKQQEEDQMTDTSMAVETKPAGGNLEKKKPRPTDVFGRTLPTEEEFEVLKNAPRLDTGLPARSKPFGIEVRNVKCVRCGTYGHQSGDRECPLKDAIMPNEETRLKRDDPLNAILAHTDPNEPLKWELKQKPGISPPRGGFKPDDPNQQIVAEEIFDEYGGFLGESSIPELLTNFSSSKTRKKSKKKSKHGRHSSASRRDTRAHEEDRLSPPPINIERMSRKEKKHNKRKYSDSSTSDDSEIEREHKKSRHKNYLSEDSEFYQHHRSKGNRKKKSYSSSSEDDTGRPLRSEKNKEKHEPTYKNKNNYCSRKHHRGQQSRKRSNSSSSEDDTRRHHRIAKNRENGTPSGSSESDHQPYKHHRSQKGRKKSFSSSSDDDAHRHSRKQGDRQKHLHTDHHSHKHGRSERSRQKYSYLDDSDYDGRDQSKHNRHNYHRHRRESE